MLRSASADIVGDKIVKGSRGSIVSTTQLRAQSVSDISTAGHARAVADSGQSGTLRRELSISKRPLSMARTVPASGTERRDPIRKQGYLLKKSKFLDSWRRRFFVLRNGCLMYYENETVRRLHHGGDYGLTRH